MEYSYHVWTGRGSDKELNSHLALYNKLLEVARGRIDFIFLPSSTTPPPPPTRNHYPAAGSAPDHSRRTFVLQSLH